MRKDRITLILSLLVLGATLYVSGDIRNSISFNGTETRVIDGDTVDFRMNGRNVTVRLLGVDAPETHGPTNPEEFGMQDSLRNRECLERWGREARDFTERYLKNRSVRISTDPAAERRGDYGRLLAYVKSSRSSSTVNLLLIEKGLARVYETDFRKLEEFRKEETEAKRKDLGLWGCD
ncbi:MAG: thermonuclease family protein [Candidatus Nanosalina sp.]